MSRSEVDRAGEVLRAVKPTFETVRVAHQIARGDFRMESVIEADVSFDSDSDEIAETVSDAIRKVLAFREGNGFAMQFVHRDIGPGFSEMSAAVSSRHKRMQAIVDKLQRFHHMRLSQMDDIAGCRVVVHDLKQIRIVQDALEKTYEIHHVDDYVAGPKPIGYRALHVVLNLPETNVVMKSGSDSTFVEVQIRTVRQNEWADRIEAATGTTGYDLKGGNTNSLPEDLVEYVRVASDIRALADQDEPADTGLSKRLAALRDAVRPYFQAR